MKDDFIRRPAAHREVAHEARHDPQAGGLATAGRSDERRDIAIAEREVDILQGVGLAVVEVEMAHFELDRVGRGTGGSRGGTDTGDRRGNAHRRAPGLSTATTKRATMLSMRIVRVISSAPDHASCCQFLYGLWANR